MSWRILVLAAVLLGACRTVTPEKVLTVNDVAGRLKEYDGRVIRIKGWLKECRGVECVLRGADYATLSIAQGPFDQEMHSRAPAEFVLIAKVDASCESEQVVCIDRTPDLHVLKIERSRRRPPPLKLEGF